MVPDTHFTSAALATDAPSSPSAAPAPDPVRAAYDGLITALAAAYAAKAGADPEEAERSTRFLAAARAQRDRWVAGDASPTRAARAKAA